MHVVFEGGMMDGRTLYLPAGDLGPTFGCAAGDPFRGRTPGEASLYFRRAEPDEFGRVVYRCGAGEEAIGRYMRKIAAAEGMVGRDFARPDDRLCHVCGRPYGVAAMAAALVAGSLGLGPTGRLFCLPGCHEQHRANEGF